MKLPSISPTPNAIPRLLTTFNHNPTPPTQSLQEMSNKSLREGKKDRSVRGEALKVKTPTLLPTPPKFSKLGGGGVKVKVGR